MTRPLGGEDRTPNLINLVVLSLVNVSAAITSILSTGPGT